MCIIDLTKVGKVNSNERTFIIEEKVAGTDYWESISIKIHDLENAITLFNQQDKENIRLVEVLNNKRYEN